MQVKPVTLCVNAETWTPEELTANSIQMILNMGLEYEILDYETNEILGSFVHDPDSYKGYKFLPSYELVMLQEAQAFKESMDRERELHKALYA